VRYSLFSGIFPRGGVCQVRVFSITRNAARKGQFALWCSSCGASGTLLRGSYARCYAAERRNFLLFAGFRLKVLERDRHACQVCEEAQGAERLHVHHRKPGASRERLIISRCPAHHAQIHRLQVLDRTLPAPAVELWRELHPGAPEQLFLGFEALPEDPYFEDKVQLPVRPGFNCKDRGLKRNKNAAEDQKNVDKDRRQIRSSSAARQLHFEPRIANRSLPSSLQLQQDHQHGRLGEGSRGVHNRHARHQNHVFTVVKTDHGNRRGRTIGRISVGLRVEYLGPGRTWA